MGQNIKVFEEWSKYRSGWHEEEVARLKSILPVDRILVRSFLDRKIKKTVDA